MRSESPRVPDAWDARGWFWLLGAPRAVLRPRVLLPVWIVLNVLAALRDLPRAGGGAIGVALGCVAVPILGGWVCAGASRGPAPPRRPFARALPPLVLAPLITIATPLLFLALLLSGGLLGHVPAVGMGLVHVWALTVGLVLAVLAAGWALIGGFAMLLQVPAAAVEYPLTLDVVSRTISYVRHRPLRLLAGWGTAILAAGLGTLAFLGLLFGVLWALQALVWVGEGVLPDPALTAESAARALLLPGTWWPLSGGSDLHAQRLLDAFEPPFWLVPLARLAPAYLFASLWAGATRVYLLIRREIDGIAVGQVES